MKNHRGRTKFSDIPGFRRSILYIFKVHFETCENRLFSSGFKLQTYTNGILSPENSKSFISIPGFSPLY